MGGDSLNCSKRIERLALLIDCFKTIVECSGNVATGERWFDAYEQSVCPLDCRVCRYDGLLTSRALADRIN